MTLGGSLTRRGQGDAQDPHFSLEGSGSSMDSEPVRPRRRLLLGRLDRRRERAGLGAGRVGRENRGDGENHNQEVHPVSSGGIGFSPSLLFPRASRIELFSGSRRTSGLSDRGVSCVDAGAAVRNSIVDNMVLSLGQFGDPFSVNEFEFGSPDSRCQVEQDRVGLHNFPPYVSSKQLDDPSTLSENNPQPELDTARLGRGKDTGSTLGSRAPISSECWRGRLEAHSEDTQDGNQHSFYHSEPGASHDPTGQISSGTVQAKRLTPHRPDNSIFPSTQISLDADAMYARFAAEFENQDNYLESMLNSQKATAQSSGSGEVTHRDWDSAAPTPTVPAGPRGMLDSPSFGSPILASDVLSAMEADGTLSAAVPSLGGSFDRPGTSGSRKRNLHSSHRRNRTLQSVFENPDSKKEVDSGAEVNPPSSSGQESNVPTRSLGSKISAFSFHRLEPTTLLNNSNSTPALRPAPITIAPPPSTDSVRGSFSRKSNWRASASQSPIKRISRSIKPTFFQRVFGAAHRGTSVESTEDNKDSGVKVGDCGDDGVAEPAVASDSHVTAPPLSHRSTSPHDRPWGCTLSDTAQPVSEADLDSLKVIRIPESGPDAGALKPQVRPGFLPRNEHYPEDSDGLPNLRPDPSRCPGQSDDKGASFSVHGDISVKANSGPSSAQLGEDLLHTASMAQEQPKVHQVNNRLEDATDVSGDHRVAGDSPVCFGEISVAQHVGGGEDSEGTQEPERWKRAQNGEGQGRTWSPEITALDSTTPLSNPIANLNIDRKCDCESSFHHPTLCGKCCIRRQQSPESPVPLPSPTTAADSALAPYYFPDLTNRRAALADVETAAARSDLTPTPSRTIHLGNTAGLEEQVVSGKVFTVAEAKEEEEEEEEEEEKEAAGTETIDEESRCARDLSCSVVDCVVDPTGATITAATAFGSDCPEPFYLSSTTFDHKAVLSPRSQQSSLPLVNDTVVSLAQPGEPRLAPSLHEHSSRLAFAPHDQNEELHKEEKPGLSPSSPLQPSSFLTSTLSTPLHCQPPMSNDSSPAPPSTLGSGAHALLKKPSSFFRRRKRSQAEDLSSPHLSLNAPPIQSATSGREAHYEGVGSTQDGGQSREVDYLPRSSAQYTSVTVDSPSDLMPIPVSVNDVRNTPKYSTIPSFLSPRKASLSQSRTASLSSNTSQTQPSVPRQSLGSSTLTSKRTSSKGSAPSSLESTPESKQENFHYQPLQYQTPTRKTPTYMRAASVPLHIDVSSAQGLSSTPLQTDPALETVLKTKNSCSRDLQSDGRQDDDCFSRERAHSVDDELASTHSETRLSQDDILLFKPTLPVQIPVSPLFPPDYLHFPQSLPSQQGPGHFTSPSTGPSSGSGDSLHVPGSRMRYAPLPGSVQASAKNCNETDAGLDSVGTVESPDADGDGIWAPTTSPVDGFDCAQVWNRAAGLTQKAPQSVPQPNSLSASSVSDLVYSNPLVNPTEGEGDEEIEEEFYDAQAGCDGQTGNNISRLEVCDDDGGASRPAESVEPPVDLTTTAFSSSQDSQSGGKSSLHSLAGLDFANSNFLPSQAEIDMREDTTMNNLSESVGKEWPLLDPVAENEDGRCNASEVPACAGPAQPNSLSSPTRITSFRRNDNSSATAYFLQGRSISKGSNPPTFEFFHSPGLNSCENSSCDHKTRAASQGAISNSQSTSVHRSDRDEVHPCANGDRSEITPTANVAHSSRSFLRGPRNKDCSTNGPTMSEDHGEAVNGDMNGKRSSSNLESSVNPRFSPGIGTSVPNQAHNAFQQPGHERNYSCGSDYTFLTPSQAGSEGGKRTVELNSGSFFVASPILAPTEAGARTEHSDGDLGVSESALASTCQSLPSSLDFPTSVLPKLTSHQTIVHSPQPNSFYDRTTTAGAATAVTKATSLTTSINTTSTAATASPVSKNAGCEGDDTTPVASTFCSSTSVLASSDIANKSFNIELPSPPPRFRVRNSPHSRSCSHSNYPSLTPSAATSAKPKIPQVRLSVHGTPGSSALVTVSSPESPESVNTETSRQPLGEKSPDTRSESKTRPLSTPARQSDGNQTVPSLSHSRVTHSIAGIMSPSGIDDNAGLPKQINLSNLTLSPTGEWVPTDPNDRDLLSPRARVWLQPSDEEEGGLPSLDVPVYDRLGPGILVEGDALDLDSEEGSDHLSESLRIVIPDKESLDPTDEDFARARLVMAGDESVVHPSRAAGWLGEPGPLQTRTRTAFMSLFDFHRLSIVSSFRRLCCSVVLRAESQQLDRLIGAFAHRWVECNPRHGFRSTDVVHAIAYSILMLNTDLHMADIGSKMTQKQFVRNAMPALLFDQYGVDDESPGAAAGEGNNTLGTGFNEGEPELEAVYADRKKKNRLSRLTDRDIPLSPRFGSSFAESGGDSLLLVDGPPVTNPRVWEGHLEDVLRSIYISIQRERLPLHGMLGAGGGGGPAGGVMGSEFSTTGSAGSLTSLTSPSSASLALAPSGLMRTPSVLSRSSEAGSASLRAVGGRWRRPRIMGSGHPGTYGPSSSGSGLGPVSGRASIDDDWKSGRGISRMGPSTENLADDHTPAAPRGFGFAQAIREENETAALSAPTASSGVVTEPNTPRRETKSISGACADIMANLELAGPPWVKEGLLHHRPHSEKPRSGGSSGLRAALSDRKSKNKNWADTFAVVQRGWLRLFSFDGKPIKTVKRRVKVKEKEKDLRKEKMKTTEDLLSPLPDEDHASPPPTGAVVGGGNWAESAAPVAQFSLRHAVAAALPVPFSNTRPHVWALTLPTGNCHLFHAGTAEVVAEWVWAVNYWAGRLSRPPLVGGVSNVEFGWGGLDLAVLEEQEKERALERLRSGERKDAGTPAEEAMTAQTAPPPSAAVPAVDRRPSSSVRSFMTDHGFLSRRSHRRMRSGSASASISTVGSSHGSGRSGSTATLQMEGAGAGGSANANLGVHSTSSVNTPTTAPLTPFSPQPANTVAPFSPAQSVSTPPPSIPPHKMIISEWTPPLPSQLESNLPDHEQLRSLEEYVRKIEVDLDRHHRLRRHIVALFSVREGQPSQHLGAFGNTLRGFGGGSTFFGASAVTLPAGSGGGSSGGNATLSPVSAITSPSSLTAPSISNAPTAPSTSNLASSSTLSSSSPFSKGSPSLANNGARAIANWERKCRYLLAETVRFEVYVDALTRADEERERLVKEWKEKEDAQAQAEAERKRIQEAQGCAETTSG